MESYFITYQQSLMSEEIKADAVYTTNETQNLLKISESTIKRMLKKGILRANKVGGQYRILGKEILRLISPELEKKSVDAYLKAKEKAVKVINQW
jgi:excisionase family DNA binding protein